MSTLPQGTEVNLSDDGIDDVGSGVNWLPILANLHPLIGANGTVSQGSEADRYKLIWRMTKRLGMNGKEEKKAHGGTRTPYRVGTETMTISYPTENYNVAPHELTPGRFLAAGSHSVVNEWVKRGAPGAIAASAGMGYLWEGENSAKLSGDIVRWVQGEGNAHMVAMQANARADYEINPDLNEGLLAVAGAGTPGNWLLGVDQGAVTMRGHGIMGGDDGMKMALGVCAASAGTPPVGIGHYVGALEIGLIQALMSDAKTRKMGSIKGGTEDEKNKARTTFTKSYLKKTSAGKHMIGWTLIMFMLSRVGGHILAAAGGGGEIPAGVVAQMNGILKEALAGQDPSNMLLF